MLLSHAFAAGDLSRAGRGVKWISATRPTVPWCQSVLWRVTEIVDEISSSEYAIDHRLSRLRWKLDYSERTIARQFREPFDWPDFHQRVLLTALDPHSELISAHDASFLPKSGKQTFGLGHFFNGCASRAERGLEISTLAVVDVTRRCALTLAAAQT